MHVRGTGKSWPHHSGRLPPIRYLAAVLSLALSVGAPAHDDWGALSALQADGAAVTAAAVDLQSGTVIEQFNAEARLTPASLTKLATAAAALQAWPADKMFTTRLLSTARIVRGGVLDGDLILQGAGDPSLDDHSLWVLAAQLRGAGVKRVSGRLIVEPTPFGAVGCETKDRCDALLRSDTSYNAPLSAFGVDFGNWCVAVHPTLPGVPAFVRGCGVAELPVPVEGIIKTVRAGGRQSFWVERFTDPSGDRLRVGGDIPAGEPQQVYRSMSDPARGAALLLGEALREIGIAIDGSVVLSTQTLPEPTAVLAQTEGLSLREQLGRMLRFSNNYIADVLTLDLAADLSERPALQLSKAGRVVADFLVHLPPALPATHHSAGSGPVIFSGSGLTPENRLSASDLVGLLAHEYHDTRRFPAFYGSLIVPHDAPFPFLRGGGEAWLDRVALKTGTMEDPYSVCGVAGFLRKRDGGWIAFAAIVNGTPRLAHVPLGKALEAERSAIEALLAR
jgi:serine-type D-Ala-D-Ala carboxypeptidase/endopeptidase (penicillin-binding protein 4)